MKKILFCMGAFLCLFLAGCSNDADDEQSYADIVGTSSNDDDDKQSYADIVGTWELIAFCVPNADKYVYEVPEGERNLFVFGSDRKVKVIRKWETKIHFPLFPNEDGVFDYSYDKGKQKIHFFGVERDCIILDNEMRMEGNHSDHDGMEVDWYIFKKTDLV